MPHFLNPTSDRATLEALGMTIDTSKRVIELPASTIELDYPLMLQDWTVRGVRRNVWTDGSVLKPSASFSDPDNREAVVFCPGSRVYMTDVVIDAAGVVPLALELNTAHSSSLTRVVGAHATRACIAIRNTRAMQASHCKATGFNETGRAITGTGWLIERYEKRGTEQNPSQNLFLNCTATFCGGDGVQIVGGYNKWLGGIIEQCLPVDADGNPLTLRVATSTDGKEVVYEEETSPGVWTQLTAPTGPGHGMDIQGGDAVHVEAVWFEGVAVDGISIRGRFHSIEKCQVAGGAAADARSVRLIGGWRSSIVRCTVASATNRIAIHEGPPAPPALPGEPPPPPVRPVGAHILRHGGSTVIEPFVGHPSSADEQKGTHHVIEFCSIHSTNGHTGPGVEVNGVLVPQ